MNFYKNMNASFIVHDFLFWSSRFTTHYLKDGGESPLIDTEYKRLNTIKCFNFHT